MKEFFVKDLKKDMDITDFFMLKSAQVKNDSKGNPYLDLILGDMSGEIVCKKWNLTENEIDTFSSLAPGTIVKVKALVTEWVGQSQLRVQRIRVAEPSDGIGVSDLVKAAPEKSIDMYNYILNVAENLEDEDLKKIAVKVLVDNKERLMYYPAASKNHHAELGGLLYHMKRMLMNGDRMCEVYRNLKRDWVLCGVILHDMEKLNEIESNELGISPGYSFEGQMLGHIIMGIKSVDQMALEMGMPTEKRIMLEHMILAHHYEPEYGSPKKPLFPEAEILHYLDMIDARMFDFEQALELTEEGEFSDKVWTLDNRKLYKSAY